MIQSDTMSSPDLESPHQSLQVDGEVGEGGEDDEGASRGGGLGWYMIPRAALRKPDSSCKRSASLVEHPWRDQTCLPERPGSQAAGEIQSIPEAYFISTPTVTNIPHLDVPQHTAGHHHQQQQPSAIKQPTLTHTGQQSGPTVPQSHLPDDQTSTSSTVTLSTSRVRDWLERSPPSSNTSTQSGSSGSLLLTAANLAGLRLEGGANVARGKEIDSVSLASSTHFTMVGGYGPSRSKQVKRSICAKHSVSVLVITTCSLFLIGLTAAVYYIDMRTKAVKYYS